MNRREFLIWFSSLGALTVMPFKLSQAQNVFSAAHADFLSNRLLEVMQADAKEHGSDFSTENINNLMYAIDTIKPSNHVELAVVIMCGSQSQPFHQVTDEYVRRRIRNEKALLPDHPLLENKEWRLPDTMRLLIFREQIEALLSELTSNSHAGATLLFKKLLRQKYRMETFKQREFTRVLNMNYRHRLRDDEIKTIYEAIILNIEKARPYIYCSTLANQCMNT